MHVPFGRQSPSLPGLRSSHKSTAAGQVRLAEAQRGPRRAGWARMPEFSQPADRLRWEQLGGRGRRRLVEEKGRTLVGRDRGSRHPRQSQEWNKDGKTGQTGWIKAGQRPAFRVSAHLGHIPWLKEPGEAEGRWSVPAVRDGVCPARLVPSA